MGLDLEREQRLSSLMAQAQTGDKVAYAKLLEEVYRVLKVYVVKRLGYGPDSEDTLQNILISIHQARHTYDRSKPFAPWMYTIAKYRVCDHWRKLSRSVELSEVQEDVEMRSTESLESISDYLKSLTPIQQRVVDLLKIQGFSIRETAQKLEMTEAAIKVVAHRAYKTLRKQFEKESNEYA